MVDAQIILLEFTSDTVAAISHLWEQLRDIETTVNAAKPLTLPPRGHSPTAAELTVFAGVGVTVVASAQVSAYGMFISFESHALKGSSVRRQSRTPCSVACPDARQADCVGYHNLEPVIHKAAYVQQGINARPSSTACESADRKWLWMLEWIFLELPLSTMEKALLHSRTPCQSADP